MSFFIYKKLLQKQLNIYVVCSWFIQRFRYQFQQEGIWFSQVDRTFKTELRSKKNFLLDAETSQAKLSLQPVNLPGTQSVLKSLLHYNFVYCKVFH